MDDDQTVVMEKKINERCATIEQKTERQQVYVQKRVRSKLLIQIQVLLQYVPLSILHRFKWVNIYHFGGIWKMN